MRYLVPRGGVAELWAAVALGWRWSFTVSQPGLGIVTRMGMGGLKGGRKGGKEGRRERMEDYRGGWGQQKRKADAGRGRVVGAMRFIFVVFGCLQGEQFKSRVSSRV